MRWSVQLASCLFWCSSPHSPPCDHQSPTDLTIPSLCPLQPMLSEAAAGWPVASCQHVPILTALTEVSLPLGPRGQGGGADKKNAREKLNMPFWQQQLREEISLAQVIPERGLRCPQTLLPMQPALPSPKAPGKAPNHIHTTLRWGRAPGKPSRSLHGK